MFITIPGLSTGQLFSQREKARKVRVGVVNEDQSELSGKLLTEVYKLQALEVHEHPRRDDAKRMLVDGALDVLVVIGPHYHERVECLDVGDLFYPEQGQLAGDLENLDISVEAGTFLANAAEVVRQLVFAFALRTFAPDQLKSSDPRLAQRLFLKARRTAHSGNSSHSGAPTNIAPGANPGNFVYQILVPSYTVMFVFFIVNFMARRFISERDMETLKRLRIADISPTGLLVGKTVPFLFISLVQTGLLFLAGRILFGMSWGAHPWMLAP